MMLLTLENLVSNAMMVFKDRIVTVFRNSPLHAEEVAVVELVTNADEFHGALCLRDLMMFAGLMNMDTTDMFVRERAHDKIELWLFAPGSRSRDFDDDPTPVQ